MTKCIQDSFDFPNVKSRAVEVNFQGGDITSGGGVLLFRQVDKRPGLRTFVSKALRDLRRKASCKYDGLSILRQRVYALASGYEDLNDYQQLRNELAIQTAVDRTDVLASSLTLCRRENLLGQQAV